MDTTNKWIAKAACRGLDTNMFFPEVGGKPSGAREICFTCPVILECLNYAVENNEDHGIWGGMPPRMRRTHNLQKTRKLVQDIIEMREISNLGVVARRKRYAARRQRNTQP